jgi:hypothetical protein
MFQEVIERVSSAVVGGVDEWGGGERSVLSGSGVLGIVIRAVVLARGSGGGHGVAGWRLGEFVCGWGWGGDGGIKKVVSCWDLRFRSRRSWRSASGLDV